MLSKDDRNDRAVLWAFVAFQLVICLNFYWREIAWYPPQYWDQTYYLTESYRLQEDILDRGFARVLSAATSKGHPTGLALPIEGALFGVIFGGTRWPQLFINFLAFVSLQLASFYTARGVWNRRVYGYLILGLILCQGTAWLAIGGLFDFRIDFVAYCLYGIWCCGVIRSLLFLNRGWSIGCGLIGALLVLHRFITVVYVAGVSAGFALVCLTAVLFWRRDHDFRTRVLQRLLNLCFSLLALAIAAAPALIFNWRAIRLYYVLGHGVSDERFVRAREAGVVDLAGYLLFYPVSILRDHWGPTFLWGSVLAIGGGLVAGLFSRREYGGGKGPSRRDDTFRFQIIFLVGAILGPIVVLTADVAKSGTVAGVVGVPAALLIVTIVGDAIPNISPASPLRKIVVACSILVFALGFWNEFRNLSRHLPEYAQERDLKRLADLDKWLVDYAAEQGWKHPTISFDIHSTWLNATAITAGGYEQSRKFVDFRPLLGSGVDIMGTQKAEALSMLAKSDFVILTTLPKTGVYPFYHEIAQYWGELKTWAEKNMYIGRTVRFDNLTATVYVRPSAFIGGFSGQWITKEGLSITAPRAALERFPTIRLSGQTDLSWLPKIPEVSASFDTVAESHPILIPGTFRRTDNGYEILIDTFKIELPPSDPVNIQLRFDTFFVPKKIGINDDTRELVVRAPTTVQLIRPGP